MLMKVRIAAAEFVSFPGTVVTLGIVPYIATVIYAFHTAKAQYWGSSVHISMRFIISEMDVTRNNYIFWGWILTVVFGIQIELKIFIL